jgi:hypothetical protein
MTVVRRKAGSNRSSLRVTYPDGSTKTWSFDALETMESVDPYTARCLQNQAIGGEFELLAERPARIDYDVDAMPKETRDDTPLGVVRPR